MKCVAHNCPNNAVARFELIMDEEERAMALSMRLDTKPVYCPIHTEQADRNSTMKFMEALA